MNVEAPAEPGARSPVLRAVVAAVLLEVALLVGVAVLSVVGVVRGNATEPGAAVLTAALSLLVGGFLAASARGLWRGRRWARAPVVTWQLLQLTVAVPTALGPRWWVGAALVAVSLVAGVGLFVPRVVAETAGTSDPPVT